MCEGDFGTILGFCKLFSQNGGRGRPGSWQGGAAVPPSYAARFVSMPATEPH
jgi:hypothetical protein